MDWPSFLRNLAMFLIVVLLMGLVLALPALGQNVSTEVQIGLVIVLAVAAVTLLLYLVAAGFSHYQLDDATQALGLPRGSIRALIAIFLIMLFVIMSIYLYRTIAFGVAATQGTLIGVPSDQLQTLITAGRVAGFTVHQPAATPPTYDVTLALVPSQDGARLAQQLVTTVGTLVVAVAGFYFGTSAVAAGRSVAAPMLSVTKIDPETAAKGPSAFPVTIYGTGFMDGAQVRLHKDGAKADMTGQDLDVNPMAIKCTFDLSLLDTGKWDVIVRNPDGTEVEVSSLFTVQ